MASSRSSSRSSKNMQAAKTGAEYFSGTAVALGIGFDALSAFVPIALIVKLPVTYLTALICGCVGGCTTYRKLQREEKESKEDRVELDEIFHGVEDIKHYLQGPQYQQMEEKTSTLRHGFFSDVKLEEKTLFDISPEAPARSTQQRQRSPSF